MNKYIIYSIVLFLFSCVNETETIDSIKYFDSKSFVQREIKSLLDKNVSITKTIIFNNKRESQVLNKIDSSSLYLQFKELLESNINENVLLGKYKEEKHANSTLYTLVKDSKKQNVKSVFINQETKKSVDSIYIISKNSNLLLSFSKEIFYKSKDYMEVKAYEKTRLQDTIFYEIRLDFELD